MRRFTAMTDGPNKLRLRELCEAWCTDQRVAGHMTPQQGLEERPPLGQLSGGDFVEQEYVFQGCVVGEERPVDRTQVRRVFGDR